MSFQEFKIGDLATQVRGLSYKGGEAIKDEADGYIPVLRANNILEDFNLDLKDLVYIPEKQINEKQLLQHGDVVIAASSGSIKVVGKGAAFKDNFKCSFGAFCKVVRPNKEKILPEYLWHYFQSDQYRYTISSLATGANILNLKNEHISELRILVPENFNTQRQIVRALDLAKAISQKRKKSIILLDNLLRGTFSFLFGDPSVNPHQYPLVAFNEVFEDTQYGTNSKASEDQIGIPILRMNNITYDGFIDLTDLKWINMSEDDQEKYSLKNRDILFNRTNSRELVGKTAVWTHGEGYTFAGYLVRIRFDESEINPFYASCYLNSLYGKKLLYNSVKLSNNMTNISPTLLGELMIPKPPIELQREFEKIFLSIQERKEKIKGSLIQCDSLYQALLQRAFHGDLLFNVDLQLDTLIKGIDSESISKDDVLVQRLIDRINQLKTGTNEGEKKPFDSLDQYEAAKSILFELMSQKRVIQIFDEVTKQIELEIA